MTVCGHGSWSTRLTESWTLLQSKPTIQAHYYIRKCKTAIGWWESKLQIISSIRFEASLIHPQIERQLEQNHMQLKNTYHIILQKIKLYKRGLDQYIENCAFATWNETCFFQRSTALVGHFQKLSTCKLRKTIFETKPSKEPLNAFTHLVNTLKLFNLATLLQIEMLFPT